LHRGILLLLLLLLPFSGAVLTCCKADWYAQVKGGKPARLGFPWGIVICTAAGNAGKVCDLALLQGTQLKPQSTFMPVPVYLTEQLVQAVLCRKEEQHMGCNTGSMCCCCCCCCCW
jgi:hypothetical protein